MIDEVPAYQNWYGDINGGRKMTLENNVTLCPSCCTPFDKGKHRKLIDTCGHEMCYMCITADHCPLCVYHANQSQNFIQQSTPQNGNIPRPRLKTNGHFTPFMQAREKNSPERPSPVGLLPPKAVPPIPSKKFSFYSPRQPRSSRSQRHMKWPSVASSDSHAAFSDDEVTTNSRSSRDHDLYARLGLLLGDRVSFGRENSPSHRSSQDSYASISSLASSEANTSNTSPLSTLTDTSDIDQLYCMGSQRKPSRDESADSVVSLMSTSTGNSSCSSPINTQFQRHAPARTSDSFVQFAKRNLRRQLHHQSQESALNLSIFGRKSQATKLLNKTLKPIYFEVPQTDSDSLFIGRHWLFKEIEQEMSNESKSKKAIVIMGSPGSGKTAIVSQLVEHSSFRVKKEDAIYHEIQSLDGSDYNMSNSSSSDSGLYQSISTLHLSAARSLGNRIVAYHLCQAENYITCMVPEFVHSIAAHLCRAPQLTAYRDLVARDERLQEMLSMPFCIADASSAFLHGIIEPLNTLRSKNRIPNTTCLIIVDGLNEAEYHKSDYGDTIASFLVRHFDVIPSWLKVIATIRSAFHDLVKHLPSHCILLDKVSSNENLHKDLCSYIMHRINSSSSIRANITVNNSKVEGSCSSRFAAHLANLSKGSMLYTRLTLDLIEKGHLVVKSSSYRVLPVCLSEVYTLSFNLKFTTISKYEMVTPILQVCLASLYPLTHQELFENLNARFVIGGISWEEFVNRLDILSSGNFLVTRLDGTVMFAHPSMREWLLRRDENESTKFMVDVRAGHASIALRMSRSAQKHSADDCLEFGHHALKAHIYKNTPKELLAPNHPRDLQAYWVNLGSDALESSLGSLRNVYSPNVKVSRLLLLGGANPKHLVPSLNNMPIVVIASQLGYFEVVALLIEFGADVNATSNSGHSALALASKNGHLDVVRLLIANGAKINQLDDDGRCPAVHGASNGHVEVVTYLFQCNWPSEKENGPNIAKAAQCCLIAAAMNGHSNVCEFLLDLPQVKPNDIDMLTGHTPLTAASLAGHLRACNILLRRGAMVNALNQRKDTPLLCATAEGHWEVAEKLLLHGAAIEEADSMGRTPLMLSAIGGHPVLELLLSKGALTESTDKDGLTALSWACLKGQYQAVQCLLSHGADANHVDQNGRSPLDFAAYHGDPEIVNLLLESGALMEHVDLNGMRPLDRAINCKNTAAVIRFLHKGAKLGSQTWQLAQGNPDILILLLAKLLEDATILCKRSKLKDAAHRYIYALKKFPTENFLSLDLRFLQIKFQLYLGLSRCRRKMGELQSAIEAADQAIALKPKSFEGYYARGRARESLGLHESALSDIIEALKVAPQNQDMKRMLIRLKDHISEATNPKQTQCDTQTNESYIGFSGLKMPETDDFGSSDTIDRLCDLTLHLVDDLTQMKDRFQDSGCESIH